MLLTQEQERIRDMARDFAQRELAPRGEMPGASCVCPGPTDTPMLQSRPDKLKEAFVRASRSVGSPSRRKSQMQSCSSRAHARTTSPVRC